MDADAECEAPKGCGASGRCAHRDQAQCSAAGWGRKPHACRRVGETHHHSASEARSGTIKRRPAQHSTLPEGHRRHRSRQRLALPV